MLIVDIILLFCWQLGRFENDLLQNSLHSLIIIDGTNIIAAVLVGIVHGYDLLHFRRVLNELILGESPAGALLTMYLARRRVFR